MTIDVYISSCVTPGICKLCNYIAQPCSWDKWNTGQGDGKQWWTSFLHANSSDETREPYQYMLDMLDTTSQNRLAFQNSLDISQ